jgi:hypothetical protein
MCAAEGSTSERLRGSRAASGETHLGPVRVALMGDLVVPSMPLSIDTGPDISSLYDFAVCNLEGSCMSRTPLNKLVKLHNSPEDLHSMLRALRVRYANLANNHSMDFGEQGICELMAVLSGADVRHFGAGATRAEAEKPLAVSVGRLRIGFLGFSWRPIESRRATASEGGVALIPSMSVLTRLVAELRQHCDHVIVSFHWGYEYERYPLPAHRKLAHSVIDAGASVVVGHHPHVYQGIEAYGRGLIYYSLGNCYMRWPVKREADVGLVPVVALDSREILESAILYAVRDRVCDSFALADRLSLEPTVETLSEPLNLSDKAYERFFRAHRTRRRGLPTFTGSCWDVGRYVWLDVRSCLVRWAVRAGFWSRSSD